MHDNVDMKIRVLCYLCLVHCVIESSLNHYPLRQESVDVGRMFMSVVVCLFVCLQRN